MTRSFKLRKQFCMTESISDIFEKYPHYKSYEGDLISIDFGLFFKKNNNFQEIENYKNFFLSLHPKCCEDVYDDELKLVYHLAYYFKNHNMRNSNKLESSKNNYDLIPHLILVCSNDLNIEVIINDNINNQPYLVFMGNLQTCGAYYLIIQKTFIFLGEISALNAIDLLFKCHYIFSLQYHESCTKFFNFIELSFFDFKTSIIAPKVSKLLVEFGKIKKV